MVCQRGQPVRRKREQDLPFRARGSGRSGRRGGAPCRGQATSAPFGNGRGPGFAVTLYSQPRQGETAVRAAFSDAVIIRPAVMFAPDDGFLTTILLLLRLLPAYPMFGDGRTKLQPVYADDVAAAITQVLRQSETPDHIDELAGPRVYSYAEQQYVIVQRPQPLTANCALGAVPFLAYQPNPPHRLAHPPSAAASPRADSPWHPQPHWR